MKEKECPVCCKSHVKKTYCSKACMALAYKTKVSERYKLDPTIIQKRKQTNLRKYKTEHASQNKQVLEKMYTTNLKKYGSKSILGTKELNKKTAQQNKDNKVRNTLKKQETCLRKYGKISYFQTETFLKKREEKWLSIYGTINMFDISHPKTKKYKDTNLLYQSKYELYFLELVDLVGEIDKVVRPEPIKYIYEGKERYYYPDYKFHNTYIEIKSVYTYDKLGKDVKLKEKNDLKIQTLKDANKNVVLLIGKEQILNYLNTLKNENKFS
jgi:hypothetical protein